MLALVFSGITTVPAAPDVPWQSKVDPWVLQTASEGETEFLVFLTEQADLSRASALKTKLEKGTYVFETLTETAARTQPAVIADLINRGAEYRPYWVANMIWVRGGTDLAQAMAERSDVAHVYANPKVKLEQPEVTPGGEAPDSTDAIEWNITKVNAPEVWASGFTGQGVVVAGQDTGYQWDHPALVNQYRGWNGATADHNYSWHDAILSGGGVCGSNSPEPCDDHGHGTHTMGTIVGDNGGANQIGMAPGARWIGCRNMDEGVGTPATYSECYQWFIAPTRLDGTGADPSKAPDVINNSWGCPDYEGCTDPNVLLTVVQNVVAAGILTNHSAGNEGSACSTVSTPAAIYDASFTVGATDGSDNIAGFSSRGPVLVDGSGRMKPDISAPGEGIRSSTPGNGYGTMSGTSMAGPHVTGLVALLISANPELAGQVNTLETVIEQSAVPRTTSEGCGGDSSTDVPNNIYGWGRIDALAAFESINQKLNLTKTPSTDIVLPGGILTYTLTVSNPYPSMPINNVVVTDTIPEGTSFVTASSPYLLEGDTITWEVPDLAPSARRAFQLVVQAPLSGTITNYMYGATSDKTSPVQGVPVLTQVIPYSLELVKTAPESVATSDLLTYTLTVTNSHPTALTQNLVLTDVLPEGTEFITATQPYSMSGVTITWTTSELAPMANWSVQLAVRAPVTFIGSVVNEGYAVRSDEVETVSGEPVITDIQALALSKKASTQAVSYGDLITYTLNVTNLHPLSTTHHVVLTDSLSLGTSFISATLPYSLTGDMLTWAADSLDPGETFTVNLIVEVLPEASKAVVNDSYYVTSEEVTVPIYGDPVITPFKPSVYFPRVFKSANSD